MSSHDSKIKDADQVTLASQAVMLDVSCLTVAPALLLYTTVYRVYFWVYLWLVVYDSTIQKSNVVYETGLCQIVHSARAKHIQSGNLILARLPPALSIRIQASPAVRTCARQEGPYHPHACVTYVHTR